MEPNKKSNKGKKQFKLVINSEVVAIILIAALQILLITICNHKINQIQDSRSLSLPVEEASVLDDKTTSKLIEQLKLYNSDPSKMLEIYSTNFDLIARLVGHGYEANVNDIKYLLVLQNILLDNEEGYCTYKVDNVDQILYFKHIDVNNEDSIVMIWLPYHEIKGLWVIPFMGMIILILIFVLFNLIVLKYQRATLKNYNTIRRI
jgi:hypothetical protein